MGRGRRALARTVRKYQDWLNDGTEVLYPNCFWKQLGVCAVLFLVIFGLKNTEAAPVQAVLSELKSVATTEFELGEDFGRLQFVGNFVPESVLVFWNADDKTLAAPLEEGILLLEDDAGALFEGSGPVCSGGEGRVEQIERKEDGYLLTIRHDNGLTATLWPLTGVRTAIGERVHVGQSVGIAQETGVPGTVQIRIQVQSGQKTVEAAQWLR